MKLGIARDVKSGLKPISGLRHIPDEKTTGWYIWTGEDLSFDPDFSVGIHVAHLEEWCPAVIRYLALPAGWRFLIADDYEDVLYDPSLLNPDR